MSAKVAVLLFMLLAAFAAVFGGLLGGALAPLVGMTQRTGALIAIAMTFAFPLWLPPVVWLFNQGALERACAWLVRQLERWCEYWDVK